MTDILQMLRRGAWILVLTTLLGLAGGQAYTETSDPVYRATTKLYLAVQTGETNAAGLSQRSAAELSKVQSYVPIVTSELVLEQVIRDEGLGMTAGALGTHVAAVADRGSNVVNIAVTSTDAAQAAHLTTAIAEQFSKTVTELEQPLEDGSSPVKITALVNAAVPTTPIEPRPAYNLALGGIIGLVLGLAIVLARGMLDTRIRSASEIEHLDLPLLGGLGYNAEHEKTPLVVTGDARSPLAEAFRDLRTNIAYSSSGNETPVIMMTSAMPSEGKTTSVTNLAISTAESDARVLLIDADLRRPRIADVLGIEGAAGLSDILVGRAEPDDVIQRWGTGKLDVLPAGRIPPNPSELLGSESMRQLLAVFADAYDIVLIDAPPTLPVTDAAVLSGMVTGVVFAAAAKQTRRPSLTSAVERLTSIDAKVLGVVVTKIRSRNRRDFSYGGYGYGYGYGSYEPRTAALSLSVPETGGRRARTS
ncbi:polysaccharide biosynthesis tyrosine autokinase [Curtobacterium sp. A7_M15]|uniref:polysaccharide biosynthesis tyrosine autokinase n=1 Tax=Curtobacterium sp. A7_M15 TaxID=3065241 RepID=UPI002737D4A6|nr:polysaccharide biosynthesis tyrosine autokinase [Curtobacterium sp. A7_M15]MDP4333732.1 polysaccharide biosynthesis tyrosine autokinase [Curtobacterium sp. A7_M15]